MIGPGMGFCFTQRLSHSIFAAIVLLEMTSSGSIRNATGQETATPVVEPESPAETKPSDDAIKEGHSVHGEVFNEGPRQAAWLMNGCGVVKFPVTTSNAEARNV